MNGSTKRTLRKEYIPLIIAVLVLIVLVLALVIVIFYDDNKGLVVPDLPEKEAISAGVYDISDGKYDKNKLFTDDMRKVKINYNVISDYYKNGVVLSNPIAEYFEDEIIITSSSTSVDPFVSAIDYNCKLKWLSKIDKGQYENFKTIKTIRDDKSYYVFLEGTLNGKKDIIAIKLNDKGNVEKREILLSQTSNDLKTVMKIDNGFALGTAGTENIKLLFVSKEFSFLENVYSLAEKDYNIFHSMIPRIMSSSHKDNKVSYVIQYKGYNDDKMYLLEYDLASKKGSIKAFTELQKISNGIYTNEIIGNEGKYYTLYDKKVYKFSLDGKLEKTYDYSSTKIEEDKKKLGNACIEDIMAKECNMEAQLYYNNDLFLKSVRKYQSTIMVSSITNFNRVIDVFDENMNLKRRYLIDLSEYDQYEQAWKFSEFYINDKLYELYVYGADTPSIMITEIG